jgi:Tol biopolymer transport system component
MKLLSKLITLLIVFNFAYVFGQFGQNKVQYKDFTWYYIQSKHFDIYFSQNGGKLAEFTAGAAEDALKSIERSFNYKINNRVTIIIYNSHNDFQETNVTDEYLTEGIGGFTELFKNRVVLPYEGSYKNFRHVIHHELTHAVINDMFYGGSAQNIISNNISLQLPLWFNEGMAEYQSLGWDTNTDMFIRDAAISEYLPDIPQLDNYFAYRGGQSVFHYIAEKYGDQKIGELINKIKGAGNVEEGFKSALGLKIEELNERWKKDIKKTYWPDIAKRKDPDEFAKRLTDHRKDGGFYNTSPALSPQGDKIAFISNRDYYFDVYIMNAIDGKIIKRLVKGNRSADFEELNILTPGLTWSPDGSKIAMSVKSNGYDIVYVIDVNSEDKTTLPIEKIEGIASVTWSPDSKSLAFTGHTASQSDIYIYNIEKNELVNLTQDLFTDADPAWTPDGSKIYFSSDRGKYLSKADVPDTFAIYKHNINQMDIYYYDLNKKDIVRVTDIAASDENYPVVGPDGKEILFISDMNGISNIYKKRVVLNEKDTVKSIVDIPAVPVTNSLNGIHQIAISKDGKKLVFSSMYQAAYSIFLLNNPFEIKLDSARLEPTNYIAYLQRQKDAKPALNVKRETKTNDSTEQDNSVKFFTGQVLDTVKTYGDSVQIDFSHFVFGDYSQAKKDTVARDTAKAFNLTDNFDSQGNFKVNKYKINFSPDIIYANAGFSSLYGLLGTTVISFSDVLGNHRIIGQTSLQIDLKNSDYGLAYYYLPNRLDIGIEGFHTARFVYLQRGIYSDLFRFRNYGAILSASYPINRYYRIDAGLSWLNVTGENLDDPSESTEKNMYLIPAMSFVKDNVIYGYTAPIDGTRYKFDVFGNPGVGSRNLNFYSFMGDYRTYFRFWTDYSFAFRLSGGASGGKTPQRFFIGGVDNWINRTFATGDVPLENASDFAFLTPALPLRGFDYAEQIGSKYGLMNLELRFPLIRYLVTGALPVLFQNIIGVAFIDAGSAWNDTKSLKFFTRDANNSIISQDLLMGTGFGARLYFLYFLMRFDMAWAYDVKGFSQPKFYFSLGADF